MQLKVEQDLDLEDIHVLIRYSARDQQLRRLLTVIKGLGEKIEAHDETGNVLLSITDIFYFESVDKRTFAYCSTDVYQVSDRLYQIKEKLSRYGFVQVSKTCVLNSHVLQSVRKVHNSRMEAQLSNGERVIVSRKYVPELQAALKR